MLSRDIVRTDLTIAAPNVLSILRCDIQNAYLTAPCRKNIWMTAGNEFGSTPGKKMLLVRVLYGLKLSGAAFRTFLAEALYNIGYKYSVADPDVWLMSDIKEKDGFRYWEYVLCYVDDVLCISKNPMHTTKGIQSKLKLKDEKMEKTNVYLGAELFIMDN